MWNQVQQFVNSSQPSALPTLPVIPIPNNPILDTAGKIGNTIANLPTNTVNTIVGQGMLDPTIDIGRLAGAATSRQLPPTYDQMKSPQAKFAYNLLGKQNSPENVTNNMLSSINPVLTAWALKNLLGSNLADSGNAITDVAKKASSLPLVAASLLKSKPSGFIDYGAKIGGGSNVAVQNILKSGKTLGQIQEEHQQATGLGALARLDRAENSGDLEGMKKAVQEIKNAPQGSPLAQYKNAISDVEKAIEQKQTAINKFSKDGYKSLTPDEKQYISSIDLNQLRMYNPHIKGGDIQEVNQIKKGLSLLANIDTAIQTKNYALAKHLAQVASKDPKYSQYQSVINSIISTIPSNPVDSAVTKLVGGT